MTDTLLIGRGRPAAALHAAMERTVASHGGFVLVAGEAGIGKTTPVTGVAADHRDEMLVAFAASWESEVVPEYWPWTRVLRSIRARLGEAAWEETPASGVLGAGASSRDRLSSAPSAVLDSLDGGERPAGAGGALQETRALLRRPASIECDQRSPDP